MTAQTRVVLLYKNSKITAKDFGGEGTGAQSFFNYGWKVDVTYGFLMRAEPTPANTSTSFTLWIRNGDTQDWFMFASFSRPSQSVYFSYLYAFTENFAGQGSYPFKKNGGAVSRTANYGNGYKYTLDGKWIDAYMATFTVDDCGQRKYRFDSSAGLDEGTNSFFLQMGGFGDAYTVPRTVFKRKPEPVPTHLAT